MNLIGRFRTLGGGLDHPEGVAWDPAAGVLYAGGEAGQLYRVTLEGAVEQVASTGGFLLGIAVADEKVLACDVAAGAVVAIDPATGSWTTFADGDGAGDRMRAPNWLAFDERGRLYVTDSGDWDRGDGRIWVVEPDGSARVWTDAANRLPNGCCLSADGEALLVIETNGPSVSRIPILADASAGRPELVAELPGTVPDGIALCADESLLVSCQRPDAVYRIAPDGAVELLAVDPTGQVLGAPSNVAWAGPELDRLVTSNLGRWHLTLADLSDTGLRGVALAHARGGARAGTAVLAGNTGSRRTGFVKGPIKQKQGPEALHL
ncbi:MAG TPA: SMP-30/gluconolactonase/LRE family protein [Candidatus Limnocylindrales bacterium]|nr:SMP-30/gluconolactonase/LRE family protein [Candidatus Limnocylindrales bacterium]